MVTCEHREDDKESKSRIFLFIFLAFLCVCGGGGGGSSSQGVEEGGAVLRGVKGVIPLSKGCYLYSYGGGEG